MLHRNFNCAASTSEVFRQYIVQSVFIFIHLLSRSHIRGLYKKYTTFSFLRKQIIHGWCSWVGRCRRQQYACMHFFPPIESSVAGISGIIWVILLHWHDFENILVSVICLCTSSTSSSFIFVTFLLCYLSVIFRQVLLFCQVSFLMYHLQYYHVCQSSCIIHNIMMFINPEFPTGLINYHWFVILVDFQRQSIYVCEFVCS